MIAIIKKFSVCADVAIFVNVCCVQILCIWYTRDLFGGGEVSLRGDHTGVAIVVMGVMLGLGIGGR